MLLSIYGLTYLYNIILRAIDVIVWHEAFPMLCKRLMAIEYLNVANAYRYWRRY
ncbi:hypothetical protein DsansV1_C09g0092181 [Dioscorea sansibarensis]